MSKLANRLSIRIKQELDIEVLPRIDRSYAGYYQKSAGAWSCSIIIQNRHPIFKLLTQH